MSLFLSLLNLAQTAGLFVSTYITRDVPEGYEDENGFHYVQGTDVVVEPSRVSVR